MERSKGLLSAFSTQLARSAQSVLAFHMDAFRYLVDQRTRSQLAEASGFLLEQPRRVSVTAEPGLAGVWVDPYHEALIKAARLGAVEDYDGAWAALQQRDATFDVAPSSRRKVPILVARVAARRGDTRVARHAYHQVRLMNDTDYGREAEEYLA
jgi:hypothetical protein